MKQNFSVFEISLNFLVLLHQGKRTEDEKRDVGKVKKGELLENETLIKLVVKKKSYKPIQSA